MVELRRVTALFGAEKVDNMDKDEIPTYHTDHLYLAAYLSCSGHIMIGTTSHDGRVAFVFRHTPRLSAAVADFMSGAAIPARQFSFEVLRLKRLIPRRGERVKTVDDASQYSFKLQT
ncbi:MAG: DUF5659 domain-containing protein [Candidatus Acidiferrales bacterium]